MPARFGAPTDRPPQTNPPTTARAHPQPGCRLTSNRVLQGITAPLPQYKSIWRCIWIYYW